MTLRHDNNIATTGGCCGHIRALVFCAFSMRDFRHAVNLLVIQCNVAYMFTNMLAADKVAC